MFQRKISPFEWMHQSSPPDAMVIQVFAEGTGSLTEDDLRRAVTAAGDLVPGSRLVRDGKTWRDSGIAPVVRSVDGRGLAPERWADGPELGVPLRGDGGTPTTEVVLLTGARPAAVFRAHHSVMDGRGAFLWAGIVFAVLRGESPAAAASPHTELDFVRGDDYPPGKPTRDRVRPVLQNTSARFAARGGFSRRRRVPGVHSGLVARAAVAVVRHFGLASTPFLVPVDLRRHDPAVRTTANVSLGLTLPVEAGLTAAQVRDRLRAALDGRAEMTDLGKQGAMEGLLRVPLGPFRAMAHAGDAFVSRAGNFWSFSLSNIGRIDLSAYSAPGFTATAVFMTLRRGLYGLPTLFLHQNAGHADIVLCADGGADLIPRGEALLDAIADDLTRTTT